MNTLTTGLKSWKTTLFSSILAILFLMQETEDLSDWRSWVIPAGIQVLGVFMRDADKSSIQSGIVHLWVICFVSMALLSSCGLPTSYVVDTSPYAKAIERDPSKVAMKVAHVKKVTGGLPTPNFRGSIITNIGTIGIDNGQPFLDVVVDRRSGK